MNTPNPTGAVQMQLFDLANRRVLVLGLGESGLSMARWLAFVGAQIRVADTRAQSQGADAARIAAARQSLVAVAPQAEVVLGKLAESLLDGIDLVAWSPGLSVEQGDFADFYRAAQARQIAVVGEIELFAQALAHLAEQAYKPKVIAITGTNGKTTTTALTAHLCNSAGIKARAAGNIMPAALDALRQALEQNDLPEVWVLELSSFQLALTDSLRADAATILNVSQDHLDWHQTMVSYTKAKQRIYSQARTAVFNRDDAASTPTSNAPTTNTHKVSFGLSEPAAVGDFGIVSVGEIDWLAQAVLDEEAPKRRAKEPAPYRVIRLMPAEALKIRGKHNHANALAALSLLQAVGVPMSRSLHGLRSYAGEAHRCQWVVTINEVDYIDDSKGTNVGATAAALAGMGRPCVLIAGGEGKGQDFAPLAPLVRQHARAVVLIGRDAPLIAQALESTGVKLLSAVSLHDAVRAASEQAKAGDCVLMSPACASFDMFRNYGHRAEVFVAAAQALAQDEGVVL